MAALLFLLFVLKISAQPPYVYDGVSTVDIAYHQSNWTLKYPLGAICEDPIWQKTLTIDLLRITGQGDIVLAFGTQSVYFAACVAFDGGIWINDIGRAMYVAPASNNDLYEADISLEHQYARGEDFRQALTPNKDINAWEGWLDYGTDFARNYPPLKITITGDRVSGKTILHFEKANMNVHFQLSSTWGVRDEVYLYLGVDKIHDEHFMLRGITMDDYKCSWTPAPTQTPTQPTAAPTTTPSPTQQNKSPTKGTASTVSTISPTYIPTMDSVQRITEETTIRTTDEDVEMKTILGVPQRTMWMILPAIIALIVFLLILLIGGKYAVHKRKKRKKTEEAMMRMSMEMMRKYNARKGYEQISY